ncbi:hypothetical protein NKDENANG_00800 [Candidatus Entotheonellaceae bacterium PAL068K]
MRRSTHNDTRQFTLFPSPNSKSAWEATSTGFKEIMERRYRKCGYAYFSRVIRHAHVLSGDELIALLDAVITARAPEDEADEIILADVVVRGRRREAGTGDR